MSILFEVLWMDCCFYLAWIERWISFTRVSTLVPNNIISRTSDQSSKKKIKLYLWNNHLIKTKIHLHTLRMALCKHFYKIIHGCLRRAGLQVKTHPCTQLLHAAQHEIGVNRCIFIFSSLVDHIGISLLFTYTSMCVAYI